MSLAVVAGALLLRLGSAAPPRAPARGGIKLSSCPKGGSSPAAAHDDSEAAGIETFARDYEITTSYENGSTCGAQAGENGLDGAFPRRALASTDAATKSWLQLYKSSGAGDAFDSETEAIRRANDSRYGLCSSVWTEDRDRALTISRQLEAGYTYLNNHGPTAQDFRGPFGGFKDSGFGRNLGYEGVVQFQGHHSISSVPAWLF